MKANLWTFNNGKIRNHGIVEINENGYINNEYPVEDFGDYLITKDHLSPQNAFDKWLKLTDRRIKP